MLTKFQLFLSRKRRDGEERKQSHKQYRNTVRNEHEEDAAPETEFHDNSAEFKSA